MSATACKDLNMTNIYFLPGFASVSLDHLMKLDNSLPNSLDNQVESVNIR